MASMPRLHDENFLRRSEYSSTCKDGFRSLERVQEKQKTGFARFLNKNHPSNKGIAKCTESPESMLPWLTMTCLLYCWSDRVDICVKSCHLCSFSPPLKASLMASTDHCNCRSNLETPATTYLEGVFTFNLSNWDLPNVFQYHGNFHAVPSGDRRDQETGEIELYKIFQ